MFKAVRENERLKIEIEGLKAERDMFKTANEELKKDLKEVTKAYDDLKNDIKGERERWNNYDGFVIEAKLQ